MQRSLVCWLCGAVAWALVSGCWSQPEKHLIAYVALDREFSEPLLKQFQQETGIEVLAKFDIESTKTVGLTTAIIHQRNRPQADVFWNNEILHTLRLQKLGLLDVYHFPAADGWPDAYRSRDGQWYGFAARARVLIVNTRIVAQDARPTSIYDLIDQTWKNRVGIAKPLFGTTGTHAAVLFDHLGDEKAREFFLALQKNATVLSGNKQVAVDVSAGRLAFGLTDTDDAIVEKDKGAPVEIVFPDQGDGMGTLFIPNSIAIIKGCPHPEYAQQFINFVLSPAVERQLAAGPSAQFPINPEVREFSRVQAAEPVKWLPANFPAAAERWEAAAEFLKQTFATGER